MPKPVTKKEHLQTWGVADIQSQTDYSGKPTLQPYHFLIWTWADIQRIFGL